MPTSPSLPVGYSLRGFRIERMLGRGSFGITYLAQEDITERRVVIKENFPEGLSYRHRADMTVSAAGSERQEMYDWALNSFLNEAKLLARLNHPHIVPIVTAFRELGTAYYVMPWVEGRDLYHAAPAPGQINEAWLAPILTKLLEALAYLHEQKLLHRDIKPSNILITPAGEPVLIDFGTVRSLEGTHTQTKMGTPGYAPLEQWAVAKLRGPWTDLYALGATCYRLLTGQEPPDCNERALTDPKACQLAHRPELRGRFSPELLAAIDKSFALRPAERWQSAQEWLSALQTPQGDTTDVVPSPEPQTEPQTKKSDYFSYLVVVLGLVIGMVIGGIIDGNGGGIGGAFLGAMIGVFIASVIALKSEV